MNRRTFLAALGVPLAAVLALQTSDVLAGLPRRRLRRRVRVRRRIRRHTFTRIVYGRPFWVVPVGLAVGWELMHERRVVVVREVRFVEKDGVKSEVALVEDSSGKKEEIEITREDTPGNAKELDGSELDAHDQSTPAIEKEEERD